MVSIRTEAALDIAAREALIDEAFGEARFLKTAERLREGRLPADGLSFVACDDGAVVGTVRLWNVAAGPGRAALLLGPLVVAAEARKRGLGAALMEQALGAAAKRGHEAVLLVGDAPYYARFGFSRESTGGLWLPGPYESERFLGRELVPGALDGARGLVSATGRAAPRPGLEVLIAALGRNDNSLSPRAA
jgi:predicted N-acetyltransferase YhbS